MEHFLDIAIFANNLYNEEIYNKYLVIHKRCEVTALTIELGQPHFIAIIVW